MAYHNNTPESVLNAPGVTVKTEKPFDGLNRRDLRRLGHRNWRPGRLSAMSKKRRRQLLEGQSAAGSDS